ncbi:MAG: phosphoenolpyruvate synthase, partial [Planctomycetales bacterium]|nr:phosphoenolpyruvate synthase [Planctomycetales bacterium]
MSNRVATQYVRWFDQVRIEDVALVGGKNASLGEMYQSLASRGVRVPNGFATTADAYRQFLNESGLDEKIRQILADLDTGDIANLRQRGAQVRHAILQTEFPFDVVQAILLGYENLCHDHEQPVAVAVRSSATAEDLPDASFAGQQ